MVEKTENGELKSEKKEEKFTDKGPFYGVRHTQVILLFLLICIGYSMRVNLSVAIVAMVDCKNPQENADVPTYCWKNSDIILSSFFWGYVVPQIGAGQLAKKFGARWLLVVAMAVNSIFTILIPFMASIKEGSYGVMICRIMQGLSQGFFYPCAHNMLSKWVPLEERTRLGTFVYAGGPFGTVLAMPITGWIADSSVGWPVVFYSFGSVGLLWVVLYIFLGSSNVGDHSKITHEEKEYIKMSIGHDEKDQEGGTPWKAIFTSVPVWCILIAHCGQNWGFWTLLTEIPSYMDSILKFDLKANGLLSALPYFVLWLLSFVFSALSDYFINRNICSIGMARKITTSIGMIGPAAALIGLGFMKEADEATAIALLVVAVGINSATYCGYQVNHIDLAPKHAGTLMGITNGCANIFAIIAPLAVQYIVTDKTNISQWGTVFFIAAGIYVGCAIVYILFGSGEVQSWNSSNSKPVVSENPRLSKDHELKKF